MLAYPTVTSTIYNVLHLTYVHGVQHAGSKSVTTPSWDSASCTNAGPCRSAVIPGLLIYCRCVSLNRIGTGPQVRGPLEVGAGKKASIERGRGTLFG